MIETHGVLVEFFGPNAGLSKDGVLPDLIGSEERWSSGGDADAFSACCSMRPQTGATERSTQTGGSILHMLGPHLILPWQTCCQEPIQMTAL